ncbi:hypothetical protein [Fischerella muscicola]|uniref:hypothetical protein n=1 Tax=Fischerella muscicola TaxID=92938 RepID=UPI0015E1000E|nr:hypothetical protein [Fischerella muscicola]
MDTKIYRFRIFALHCIDSASLWKTLLTNQVSDRNNVKKSFDARDRSVQRKTQP